MLAFTPVRRQLYRLAIRSVKGLVYVQHGLNRIVSWRHILQAFARIALGIVADGERISRFPSVDRYAENHLRLRRIVDLHTRLIARVVREQKQHATVQGLIGARGRKTYRDRLSGGSAYPQKFRGGQ